MIATAFCLVLASSGIPPGPSSQPPALVQVPPVPEFDAVGMHDEVREVFDRARERVTEVPGDPEAWRELGALFDAHDLHRQAEACYREALRLEPEDFRAVYLLAIVSDRLGEELEVTVPLFERAIELRPEYAPVHLHLGNALSRQGRAAEARHAYERALEVDGEFFAAHGALGQLLLHTGELEAARDHLLAAWEGAAEDVGLNASLAQVYMRLGQRDVAREYAERARTGKDALAFHDEVREDVMALAVALGARLERARRAYQLGEAGIAKDELARILEVHPEQAEVLAMLGGILLAEGRVADARDYLERAVSSYPRDADKRLLLGQALLELAAEDPTLLKPAVQNLRVAAKLAPEDGEVREVFATALARRGKAQPALENFERAAATGRVLSEGAYSLWGSALAQEGRLREAHEVFQSAFEARPDSSLLCFNLAVSLEQLGELEEAIETYERAAEMGTDYPARERAGALRERLGR